MDLHLRNKRAFVAGSSDGIGKAIAEAFAAEGCHLILCARNERKLQELQGHFEVLYGVEVAYQVADLDKPEDIERVVSATNETAGAVDILVTNNGGPSPGDFLGMSEENWLEGYNRTLMSGIRLIRGFLPGMIERGWGRVINVTSIAVKQPVARLLLSNTFRAAVTGMAKTLSDEVAGRGITVNNIAPGYIETGRLGHLFEDRAQQSGSSVEDVVRQLTASIPTGRLGSPAEIGSLAAFLASDHAAYITGTTIQVDGGLNRGLM